MSTATTFHHPTFPSCPIRILPSDLSASQLSSFPAFQTWSTTLRRNLDRQSRPGHPFHSAPYVLRDITVQSVDFFGSGKPGFVKLRATLKNDAGETLPGSVLLRGGSTAILVLLQPDDISSSSSDHGGADEDETYTLLTLQPRVPAGSLAFAELPAGMLDDSGAFAGKAAQELQEETGLTIREDELVDLTALALEGGEEHDDDDDEELQMAMYPSAGGCDEFVPLFVCRKRLPRDELEGLKGKLSGLRDEGEKITLKVVKLRDLWREGARDAKALSALALYEGLRKEGKLAGKLGAKKTKGANV